MREWWRRQRLNPGWVAVAPQGETAWVVHLLRPAGARPQLRWACRIDWRQPLQALRQLRRERQLARYRSVLLLQRPQYQLLPLEAPEVPREHWRDAARWQLKGLIDFPVDSAAIDVLEIPAEASARSRSSLLVAAAPQAEIAPLAYAAEDAGVPWQAIDIPETALRNLATLTELPGQAQALLQLGEPHSQLVITVQGELLQSRIIDVTLAQLQDADAERRQQALDRAGLELQRTLDSFERLFSRISLARLLVAPAGATEFMHYVGELVYVPVQPLHTAELLDLSLVPELADPADPAALNACLLAIGAALRED